MRKQIIQTAPEWLPLRWGAGSAVQSHPVAAEVAQHIWSTKLSRQLERTAISTLHGSHAAQAAVSTQHCNCMQHSASHHNCTTHSALQHSTPCGYLEVLSSACVPLTIASHSLSYDSSTGRSDGDSNSKICRSISD